MLAHKELLLRQHMMDAEGIDSEYLLARQFKHDLDLPGPIPRDHRSRFLCHVLCHWRQEQFTTISIL